MTKSLCCTSDMQHYEQYSITEKQKSPQAKTKMRDSAPCHSLDSKFLGLVVFSSLLSVLMVVLEIMFCVSSCT